MKRYYVLLGLLLSIISGAYAQIPTLTVGDGSRDVVIDRVNTEVNIIGNIATTKITLTFKNNSDRTLEGTLTFPMPEGVTISGYALDINGKMRQAVPVAKAKATEVFESIQHRNVDPGILEQVEGNNFRTRIFPFPARGTRTIAISYEEALKLDGQHNLKYHLPLDYPNALSAFDLKVTVTASAEKPSFIEQPDGSLSFNNVGPSYIAQMHKEHYKPTKTLSIQLPKKINTVESVYAPNEDGSAYFLINDYAQPQSKAKVWMPKIDLIWDVSLSGLKRDHAKEWAVLDLFFKKNPNTTIDLKLLNTYFREAGTYVISKGNWNALKQKLQSLIYDGGTDLSLLSKSYLRNKMVKDVLLFTDGMSTFGDDALPVNANIYTFIAGQKANYVAMQQLSRSGKMVNLNATSAADAIQQISSTYYQFLGIAQSEVTQVYPAKATAIAGHNIVTGLIAGTAKQVTLLYGWNGVVSERRTVTLLRNNNPALNLHKLWAQQKINTLNQDYKKNAAEIADIAQQFGIVTRNTSLMVLESVNDYVQYDITPPEELMAEYLQLKKDKSVLEEQRITDLLAQAIQMTTNLKEWWGTTFRAQTRFPKPQKDISTRNQMVSEDYQVGTADAPPPPPSATAMYRAAPAAEEKRMEVRDEKSASTKDMASVNITDPARKAVQQYTVETQYTAGAAEMAKAPVANVAAALDGSAPGMPVVTDNISMDGLLGTYAWSTDIVGQVEGETDYREPEPVMPSKQMPYMIAIRMSKNPYRTYLSQRTENINKPTFYYHVANYFFSKNATDTAMMILSNIAELDIEDAPLMKMLVYKMKQLGKYEKELWCAKKVLEWRPMDPQSHRDYALALADNGQYQAALDNLYGILQGSYSPEAANRDDGIEEVIVMEINQLISKHRSQLSISKIDPELIKDFPVDIRVVLNWNHMDTDIDLWVTQPNGERCMYSAPTTTAGGRISNDFTQGYGPEQFLLKKAIKGKYIIETNYFGESQFVLSGATTVMAEIYLYYGSGKEERKVVTLQMSDAGNTTEGMLVGSFTF
ncbi:VIT domain-containing protein [Taibaiella sp. KBW10]|uniref:VIT domain-containing protein n=1 Tax=Taibaiella sp. KBW10 TaxID=2153357 RepID=UPI001315A821|nr:VIT domain-containing protein [Taibaiella sp. KBW10]